MQPPSDNDTVGATHNIIPIPHPNPLQISHAPHHVPWHLPAPFTVVAHAQIDDPSKLAAHKF